MTYLKTILLAGFAATLSLAAAPEIRAADLEVTRTKSARVVPSHRVRVVRDYDGTAVVERVVRRVHRAPDGALVVTSQVEMTPAVRAQPYRYLNGQPVLPSRLRRAVMIVVTPRY